MSVEDRRNKGPVPNRWSNEQGSDEWHVEIEHDRFSSDEPFVVSIWMEGVSDGQMWDALATATPEQAREMADALGRYADNAEAQNRRMGRNTAGADLA